MDWLLDKTPEASAPDTVEESTGPARDPETGKFVSREETESSIEEDIPTDAGIEPSPEEGEEDQGDLEFELDPDVLTVLDKYDGDLNKALAALKDSQSLIGRQGNELGELRQQQQQMIELMQELHQQPQINAPYRSDVDEDPASLVIEVLERTAQTGHFDEATYEAALASWGEEDPFAAARLDAQVAFSRQQAAMIASQELQAPAVTEVTPDGGLEEAMSEVVQRHPDVEQYIPAVGEIAKEFPTLRDSMAKGTGAQKAQAFEELVLIAKSRSAADTSREAVRKIVLKTQEDVRKEKADAAVISAKNQTAAAPLTGVDLFFREFDRATGQLSEDD